MKKGITRFPTFIPYLSILVLLLGGLSARAQLTISPTQTANNLVLKLLGPGIQYSNATLNCPNNANGFFTGTSNLGIDTGIILASGRAVDVAGSASTTASTSQSGALGSTGRDASLDSISGQSTYDACVLEFDFIPSGDTVKFNYVWGSEEYPDYNCTSFNDVFGFLISGPGITGRKNIALIPNTTIPVAINTVNNGVPGSGGTAARCNTATNGNGPYTQYYINNGGNTITYNGFTTKFVAKSAVTACSTYHIKLGVADASDGIRDSGVFLQAGSFTSLPIAVKPQSAQGLSSSALPYCVRGCNPGQFTFSRPSASATPLTIRYQIQGTAINGTDYTTIPDSTTIPANGTSATRDIFALPGGPTGPRTVKLRIYSPYTCFSTTIIDSATLTILDSFQLQILTRDTTVCAGQPLQIRSIGDSLLTYSWSPTTGVSNPNSKDPIITAYATTRYTLSATAPGTGCAISSSSITISNPAGPNVPVTSYSYCRNATATQLSASGSGLKWYTSATGTTFSTTAPTPSTATPGTVTYYVSQTVNGCESGRTAIRVVTNSLPPQPTTTPVTYCKGATAIPLTASGSNLRWFDSATNGSLLTTGANGPTPSTANLGTTNYYVTQTVNGCESTPRKALAVTINAGPNAPLGKDTAYCRGSSTSVLTASGSSLKWYGAATGGTGSSTAPTPSSANAGTFRFYVSQTVSGCESGRDTVDVRIIDTTGPGVVSPVNLCQGETATPLTATGVNLLWYSAATGGTGSATAPTPSTTSTGSTNYYVSQRQGGNCESRRRTITVNVNNTALPPSVSPGSFCQGSNVGRVPSSVVSGLNLIWYTMPTGGTGDTARPVVNTSTPGVLTYYVSQRQSCGESIRDTATVTIRATPANPAATPNGPYCQGDSAAALSASGTSIRWYANTADSVGDSNPPVPATATPGVTTFYLSQNVAGCESRRDSIRVTVNAAPSAPAVTAPSPYCAGTLASPLSASGSGLKWYDVPNGGTPIATGTPGPRPSTSSPGTVGYYVSQSVGTCESPRALINVQVADTPARPVPFDVTYCQNDAAAPLNLVSGNSSPLWYTDSVNGVGASNAPTPSTANGGTYRFYVSQTVGTCESKRAMQTVVVTPRPQNPSVTPISYCQFAASVPLTANGTGGTLYWYDAATGGIGSTTGQTPSTQTAGTTGYYVSQSTNGCESGRTRLDVTTKPRPDTTAVTSQTTFCQNSTPATLTAAGQSVQWYSALTGGSGSTQSPSFTTDSVKTFTFFYTQTVNGCESRRARATIRVVPTPVAPTVSSISVCRGSTPAPVLTASGQLVKRWYASATGTTPVSTGTGPTVPTNNAGTYTYYVSQLQGACEGPRTMQQATIVDTPGRPTVTPRSECYKSGSFALTATGSSLKWYGSAAGGTGSSTPPSANTDTVGTRNYYVTQTVGGCEGNRATLPFTIIARPAAPNVPDTSYCQGSGAAQLSPTNQQNISWYTSTTGTGSHDAPTPSTQNTGVTRYYVTITQNTCESAFDTVAVTVNPIPARPTVVSPLNVCQATGSAQAVANGQALLWYDAATGGSGQSNAPSYDKATPASHDYYVTQTVLNCESPRQLLNVTVRAVPNGSITGPVTACAGEIDTLYYDGNAGPDATIRWTIEQNRASEQYQQNDRMFIVRMDSVGITRFHLVADNHGCRSNDATHDVAVSVPPSMAIIADTLFCAGTVGELKVEHSNDPKILSYAWNFDKATVVSGDPRGGSEGPYRVLFERPGIYELKVRGYTSSCVKEVTQRVFARDQPDPRIAYHNPTVPCGGDSIEFTALTIQDGNYTYQWTPAGYFPNSDKKDRVATNKVIATGYVKLEVKNELGCSSRDSVLVTVKPCCDFDMPNAFSPNGDGRNDRFGMMGGGHPDVSMFRIANRWGQTIFDTRSASETWDGNFNGEPAEVGTYFYYLKYKCVNGVSYEKKGELTLIR